MSTSPTHISFTGSIPANYDTYLGPVLFEFSAADTAQRVAQMFNKPARVLEVACGTGISTRHLAHALPKGSEIVATDLNDAMLAHAQKVNGDLPGVTYQQADALDLKFEDASFDAVVCQFGVMFFPDRVAGLSEMSRVLRDGGHLAITVWDSMDRNPAVAVMKSVIDQVFENDPPRFLEIPFGMHNTDDVRRLFESAGCDEIDIAHIEAQIRVDDYTGPAKGFITGNPTLLEIEERSNTSVDDVVKAAATALEKEFGPVPAQLPFQEIYFQARKPSG